MKKQLVAFSVVMMLLAQSNAFAEGCNLKILGKVKIAEALKIAASKKGYRLLGALSFFSTIDFTLEAEQVCVETMQEYFDANPQPRIRAIGWGGVCYRYAAGNTVMLTHRRTQISKEITGVSNTQITVLIDPQNQEILDEAISASTVEAHDSIMAKYDSSLDNKTSGISYYEDALNKIPSCEQMYGSIH